MLRQNARLIGTKFGKLKLELKDYNQQWLRNWIFIILGILSVVGFALWKRLTTKMDGLIEQNEVNKRLTDFEGAIEKVKILEPQVRILETRNMRDLYWSVIGIIHQRVILNKLRNLKNKLLWMYSVMKRVILNTG